MTCLARSLSPVMEEVSAFGACGPTAKTARARQAARTAQAQRGRRPRGRMEAAGLTCCDGDRERWKGEVSVLMGPGCRSVIVHTIQPPGRSMSGQPDKRMNDRPREGEGRRGDVGRPVLIRVSAGNGGACERPPVWFQVCRGLWSGGECPNRRQRRQRVLSAPDETA